MSVTLDDVTERIFEKGMDDPEFVHFFLELERNPGGGVHAAIQKFNIYLENRKWQKSLDNQNGPVGLEVIDCERIYALAENVQRGKKGIFIDGPTKDLDSLMLAADNDKQVIFEFDPALAWSGEFTGYYSVEIMRNRQRLGLKN